MSEAKRLVLLRHAKSSWDEPGLADHERPLNRRGRLAAALMGAWLAEQDWRIDLALLSDSARTRETWARLTPLLPATPPARELPELYHAEPEELLRIIRAAPEEVGVLLALGHNPGLEEFVVALTRRGGGVRMPTAAVAVMTIDGAWRDLDWGGATLEAFEQPKSLV